MIEVDHLGEVTRVKMGREYQGRVLYWTAAYLVDGLLIDTGCPHTAEELTRFLEGQHLDLAVNTHHHEDHVGANHQLQQRFEIPIMASRESAPLIAQSPRAAAIPGTGLGLSGADRSRHSASPAGNRKPSFRRDRDARPLPGSCGPRGDDQGLVLHGRPVHLQRAQGHASGGGHLRDRPVDEEAGRSATGEAHLVHRPGECGGRWEGRHCNPASTTFTACH